MIIIAALLTLAQAAHASDTTTFTHADTLRGSLTAPERTWWDVTFYDLHVRVSPSDSSVSGYDRITYRVSGPSARDADRPHDAARSGQHGAGRTERTVSARRQRVLCDSRCAATRGNAQGDQRLLPRQAARRSTCSVGRRIRLDARQSRRGMDRNRGSGSRREHLVAQQGYAGRRAGQRAHRDHGARFDQGRVQWPVATHDAQRRRHIDVRVVREVANQQLRHRGERRAATRTSATYFMASVGR